VLAGVGARGLVELGSHVLASPQTRMMSGAVAAAGPPRVKGVVVRPPIARIVSSQSPAFVLRDVGVVQDLNIELVGHC